MSDFEDDYDDDFDVVEYFFVEETYDEVVSTPWGLEQGPRLSGGYAIMTSGSRVTGIC